MSFFRHAADRPSGSTDSSHVLDVENVAVDLEVADGVTVERRSVLWLTVGAVTSMLAGSRALRAQDPAATRKPARSGSADETPAHGKLSHADFLKEIYPHAKRVVASKGQDEEAYIMTVAAAMTRLQEPGAPIRAAMKEFRNRARQDEKGGDRQERARFPLAAMSMKLEPGRGFDAHDHLDYNGVIMTVDGEVRIRNFDIQGDAPALDSGKTFEIRETSDDILLPGRVSTLGRNRENIHELVAGKDGARVLDVFTFFDQDATSRFLDVEAKPKDPERRIYEAAWRNRNR